MQVAGRSCFRVYLAVERDAVLLEIAVPQADSERLWFASNCVEGVEERGWNDLFQGHCRKCTGVRELARKSIDEEKGRGRGATSYV